MAAAPRSSTSTARSVPPGEHRRRPTPRPSSKADKVELLLRADEAARAAGSPIVQVSAGLRRQPQAHPRRQLRRPAGRGRPGPHAVPRQRSSPRATPACRRATSRSGTPSASSCSTSTTSRSWPARAAQRALTKLDARPAPAGSLPVVIKAGSGGVLFHEACGHGLEADLVGKGASVFRGRVGEQVASPLVTLVDDGTMTAEWGAITIDDEGHPSQRNVLIEDGVLTDYMWDFLRARKEGRPQSRQRAAPELPAPADGADDQHLRAQRRRGARRDRPGHRPRRVRRPARAAARSTRPRATSCSG